jgi:hypothetical protein
MAGAQVRACQGSNFDDSPETEAIIVDAIDWASEIAYALVDRLEGVCSTTVWKCPPPRCVCEQQCDRCICGRYSRIRLTAGDPPVKAVIEVKVNGVIVPPTDYRVDNWRDLVLITGEWPTCLVIGESAVPTEGIEIKYSYGVTVSKAAQRAVTALAVEAAKRCLFQPCGLPQRVQMVRSGDMTFPFLDPMKFIAERRTGIYEFDLWLAARNPYGDAGFVDLALEYDEHWLATQ